jgi:hypothetical protein
MPHVERKYGLKVDWSVEKIKVKSASLFVPYMV